MPPKEGPSWPIGDTRDKKRPSSENCSKTERESTTTDFAEWRDWRQVRVVISRRGHDLSCPYTRKKKKMPPHSKRARNCLKTKRESAASERGFVRGGMRG